MDCCLFGIETNGEVIEGDLEHRVAYMGRLLGVVGECLHVGDHHELIARLLKFQSFFEGADIVAEVKLTRWPIPCEYGIFHRGEHITISN